MINASEYSTKQEPCHAIGFLMTYPIFSDWTYMEEICIMNNLLYMYLVKITVQEPDSLPGL